MAKGKAKDTPKTEDKPKVSGTILPKGIEQAMYDRVKEIIVSGFKADQTPDAIKSAIFKEGVPFSKLSRLYSMITKSEGLVVDPKKIQEGIKKELGTYTFDFNETYAQLFDIAEDIVANVNGATTAKVMAAMKASWKENEQEFPRKPVAVKGKMGMINKTIVNVFKKNPQATQQDLYAALAEVTKTLKNADDYSKTYHKMAYGLANGLSATETLNHFAKLEAAAPAK